MINRFISVVMAFLLCFALFGCGDASSQNISQSIYSSVSETSSEIEETIDYPHIEYVPTEKNFTYVENYFQDIPYVGIYNAKSLKPFYTESADQPIYPASLTKMVTASVALKYGNLDDIYTVGSELDLVQPHSSLFGLRKGMELSLHHLLYGLLLPSGNDAAYTIAVNIARRIEGNENLDDVKAVEYFCGLMNQYCAEIGATNSHFTTPEGWDDDAQYTTVNDLAVIASRAMNFDVFAEIVKTPTIRLLVESGETFYVTNSNYLLHEDSDNYNPNCIGIKTGTTDLAGACLVACLTVDKCEYILIAANCPTNNSRFVTVNQLYEFAIRYHRSSKSILPKKLSK